MNIQHLRMTASELAMGRYMRAPDHPAAAEAPPAAAPAPDEPPAAATPEEDFSQAFADFSAPKSDATAAPVEPPAEPAAAAEPPAEPGAEPPAAPSEPAAAAPVEPPAEPGAESPAAEPAAAAPAEGADDIIKRLAAEMAKQPAPAPAQPAAPAAAEAVDPPIYTEQEQQDIAKFKEDWPTEARAVELMSRELGIGIIKHIFSQVGPVVREIKEMTDEIALRVHTSDLQEAIGDYDPKVLKEKIVAWSKTQPTYLQQPMLSVIEKGTADEVADLVNRYREATGDQPAPVPTAQPGASEGGSELSGEAKKAAAALAPVDSKRSVVQEPDDKSNFDLAWQKFAPEFAAKST